MRCKLLSSTLSLLIIVNVWAYFGIEEIPREHGTDYEFFAKQIPTTKMIYRNPAVCGECDAEPFATLRVEAQTSLAEFCRVRFGLENVRECYAIFTEKQRIKNEKLSKSATP
jgi:hypothetical protein